MDVLLSETPTTRTYRRADGSTYTLPKAMLGLGPTEPSGIPASPDVAQLTGQVPIADPMAAVPPGPPPSVEVPEPPGLGIAAPELPSAPVQEPAMAPKAPAEKTPPGAAGGIEAPATPDLGTMPEDVVSAETVEPFDDRWRRENPDKPLGGRAHYAAKKDLGGLTPEDIAARRAFVTDEANRLKPGGKGYFQSVGAINRAMSELEQDTVDLGTRTVAGAHEKVASEHDEGVARMDAMEAERRKAREAERARAEEAHDAYARKLDEYAEAKVDPDRFWSSMGTARQAGVVIGALLTQFAEMRASGRAGRGGATGPNTILAMLQQKIDQDVQLQMADIDKKGRVAEGARGLWNDIRQMSNDEEARYQHGVAAGWASVQGRINGMAERAKSAEVRAAGEEAKQLIAGRAVQATLAAREAERRQRIAAARAAQAEEMKRRAAVGQVPNFVEKNGKMVQAGWKSVGPRMQSLDEFKAGVLVPGTVPLQRDPNAPGDPKERETALPGLTATRKNADGTATKVPMAAASKEEGIKLRGHKAATDTLVRTLDKMIAIRNRVGWETDIGNSSESQQLKALAAQAKAILGSEHLGLRQQTKDELEKITGGMLGSDATAYKSNLSRWRETREEVITKFNTDLRAQDPAADWYDPTPTTGPATPELEAGIKGMVRPVTKPTTGKQEAIISFFTGGGAARAKDVTAEKGMAGYGQSIEAIYDVAKYGEGPDAASRARSRERARQELADAQDPLVNTDDRLRGAAQEKYRALVARDKTAVMALAGDVKLGRSDGQSRRLLDWYLVPGNALPEVHEYAVAKARELGLRD